MGKDMRKKEKPRVAICVGGNSMMVWGWSWVLAVSFVVASVSSFKSRRKKNSETSRAAEDGGNSMMVWGVAVLAVSFVVASVSSFKSRRKQNNETSRAAEELNKTDRSRHTYNR